MRVAIIALLAVAPEAIAEPSNQPAQPALTPGSSSPHAANAPDAPDAPDGEPTASPVGVHREGDYGGVRPGNPAASDSPRRLKTSPRKGVLSWIGFEAKNGSAEVFFQSAESFEVTQRVENGTLVVTLRGIYQLGQNAWRYIDTRFFDTPIARVVARRVGPARASKASSGRGAGVEVRIGFKQPSGAREASVRHAAEADGMHYAYLALPGSSGD